MIMGKWRGFQNVLTKTEILPPAPSFLYIYIFLNVTYKMHKNVLRITFFKDTVEMGREM